MLYNTKRLRGRIPLDIFPRIPANESVNHVDLIPIRTNKRIGYKIVALEDAYIYMNRHVSDLNSFLEEVTYINSIPPGNLAFSVRPSSIYFNESIKNLYKDLQEDGMPIYILSSRDSREYRLIDCVCEICITENSIDPFDIILNEGLLDSFFGGAAQGGADAASDGLMALPNAILDRARHAIVSGAQNRIDDWIGNKFGLDSTKRVQDEFNPDTGTFSTKTVVDRNAKVTEKIKNSKLINNSFLNNHKDLQSGIVDFLSDSAKDIRSSISTGAVNLLQNIVGLDPSKPIDLNRAIDAIGDKVNSIRRSISGSSNPGILNSLINKLIALKNYILGRR